LNGPIIKHYSLLLQLNITFRQINFNYYRLLVSVSTVR